MSTLRTKDVETMADFDRLDMELSGAVVKDIEPGWRQDTMNPNVWHVDEVMLTFQDGRELTFSALGWCGIESLITTIWDPSK